MGHGERELALVQDASFLLHVLLGTAGQQETPLDLGAPMGMLEFSRCRVLQDTTCGVRHSSRLSTEPLPRGRRKI